MSYEEIPHPRALPLIGDARQFHEDIPYDDLLRLADELGPIYKLSIPGRPFIIVSHPDAIAEIANDDRWDKMPSILMRELVHDGLVTAHTSEPNWGKANRLATPAFTTAGLKASYSGITEVGYQTVERLLRRDDFDQDLDVGDLSLRITLEAIGITGFGHRFGTLYSSELPSFIPTFTTIMQMVFKKAREPVVVQHLRRRRNAKELEQAEQIYAFADRMIAARRARGREEEPQDVLGRLMWGVDPVTGETLSEENLRSQIVTLMIAGHETTSALITWSIYYLTTHPEIMASAQREIDDVLGHDISTVPTWEQVHQLDVLDRVFLESLRLSPILQGLMRRPREDAVLLGRYQVPANTDVLVLLSALHRNPLWWERADEFDPDRWLPEHRDTINPNAYYPFGLGQRACIGRGFALLEARAVLGMVLRAFDLIPDPDYVLHTQMALTTKPADLHVTAVPRSGVDAAALLAPMAHAATAVVGAIDDHHATIPSPAAPAADPQGPLLVAYGSNGGTCRDGARRLGDEAALRGFEIDVKTLDEVAGQLPTDRPVLIVTSSYNGNSTQNAADFCRWLGTAPDLTGVRAGIFGVGDPSWHLTYMRVPKEIDEQMRAAGAEMLVERGEGNSAADAMTAGVAWVKQVWQALGVTETAPVNAVPRWSVSKLNELPTTIETDGLLDMQLLEVSESRELQRCTGDDPSERSTRHLELTLADGMSYETGDHLAVLALNSRRAVERMLHLLGRTGNQVVTLSTTSTAGAPVPTNVPITVRDLLRRYLDLQAPATRLALTAIIERAGDSAPSELRLLAVADDATFTENITLRRRSISDLLEDCGRPPFTLEDLLEFAKPLRVRNYSISSSPLLDSQRLTITVGQVSGPARSGHGTYRGVCSTHLLDLEPGDRMIAAVSSIDSGFRVPENPTVPIIMVGAGTGLAPFRGFVQHRQVQHDMGIDVGPALLLAGCRRSDHDRIYGDEWDAWQAEGMVEVDWGFSREPGQPRQYVQDRIRARADRIGELLEQGAAVYVCGDGSQMAPAVRTAIGEILAGGDGTPEAALMALTEANRYHEDVWAGA